MPQKKNDKIAKYVSWVLVAVCMGVIFYFSARPAHQSSQQSAFFVEWLRSIFGDNEMLTFIVRKTAHFLEFAGLSLLFNNALYFSCVKTKPLQAIIFTALYALTDEVHQIFVDGRSCEFVDWCIDLGGAVCGTLGYMVVFGIITKVAKILKNKKNNIDTKVQ